MNILRCLVVLAFTAALAGCADGEVLDEIAGRKHCNPTGAGEECRPCGGLDCKVCNGIRSYSDKTGHLDHLCDCPRNCPCQCAK